MTNIKLFILVWMVVLSHSAFAQSSSTLVNKIESKLSAIDYVPLASEDQASFLEALQLVNDLKEALVVPKVFPLTLTTFIHAERRCNSDEVADLKASAEKRALLNCNDKGYSDCRFIACELTEDVKGILKRNRSHLGPQQRNARCTVKAIVHGYR